MYSPPFSLSLSFPSLPFSLYFPFVFTLLTICKDSWSDFANRRKFFEEFAKARGFDPRIPDNWYAQSRELILSFPVSLSFSLLLLPCPPSSLLPLSNSAKGGSSILKYHKGSMAQALVDIFPDIGLDRSVFYRGIRRILLKKEICIDLFGTGFYSEVGNQRKFFENYAKQHGFDPLKPENWYKQRRKTIISTKVYPLPSSLPPLSLLVLSVSLSLPLHPSFSFYVNEGSTRGSLQTQQQRAQCAVQRIS